MKTEISFGVNEVSKSRNVREFKGKSTIAFPSTFTVIDIETTGLSPDWDNIIELSALKVNGEEIIEFSSIVNDDNPIIDSFITSLTGITQQMVDEAPDIKEVLPKFLEFIGTDILVGHNVNFDINFIYEASMRYLNMPLTNDFVDTMRISRKLFKEERHHRLADVAERYDICYEGAHRSLNDCRITLTAYRYLTNDVNSMFGQENFINSFKPRNHSKKKYVHLSLDEIEADEESAFWGKVCVITGVLEKYSRTEARNIIEKIGGITEDRVTKKTNYLILGNNDYCKSIKGGKSSKQKKAESYRLQGLDIDIISESVFYELLGGE